MSFTGDWHSTPEGLANLMGHLMAGGSGQPKRKSRVTGEGSKLSGRFELGPLRGSGRFGDVYEARQFSPTLRAKVAIKILRRDMMSAEALGRFAREGQTLTDLDHPNITKYIHTGEVGDGRPYIAMEWVDGVPLDQWCREEAAGNWRLILEVFRQVCDAISHAHKVGIVHRDIKPSNILVAKDRDGHPLVKVIDFGIAKSAMRDGVANSRETVIGTFMGTPAYMSPEQIEGLPGEVECRSDIYSLSAVLYELVAGRPPLDFPEDASIQDWQKLMRMEHPRPASQREKAIQFPRELDHILARGLAKDKPERYTTVDDFAADLDLLLKGQTTAAKRHREQVIVYRCAAVLMGLALAAAAVAMSFVNGGVEPKAPVPKSNVVALPGSVDREPEDVRRFAAALTAARKSTISPEERVRETQIGLEIARPYFERQKPSSIWRQNWIEAKRIEGTCLREAGRLEDSIFALKEGLTALKYFKMGDMMTAALLEKEALLCHELAAVYRARKQPNGEVFWRRKELQAYEGLADIEDPRKVDVQRYVCANLRYQLAVILKDRQPAEAAELLDCAARCQHAAYQASTKPELHHEVAAKYRSTLEKRVEVASAMLDRPRQVSCLRDLITLSEESFAQTQGTDWGILAAKSRASLAAVLETGGEVERARAEYQAAVDLGRQVLPGFDRPDFSRDLEKWSRKLAP